LKDIFNRKCDKMGGCKQPPRVLWFYGNSGSGKTREAVKIGVENGGFWMSGRNLEWFDGYSNVETPVAIIDDFRKDFCTFHYLLRVLDIYPMRVPIKGGMVDWSPKYIIVTCPWRPEALYE